MAERHRCQNDLMIDEMVAAGKSEQDILTVIVAQYRPYDTLPAFDEGFNAYQTSATRMTMTKRTSGPLQRLGLCRRNSVSRKRRPGCRDSVRIRSYGAASPCPYRKFKREHIGDAARPRPAGEARGRFGARHAESAHPCAATGVSGPRCDIFDRMRVTASNTSGARRWSPANTRRSILLTATRLGALGLSTLS